MKDINDNEVSAVIFAWLVNEVEAMGLIGKDQKFLPDNIPDMDGLAADWLMMAKAGSPANKDAYVNMLASDRSREIQQISTCLMAGLVAVDSLLQRHGHTAWDFIKAFGKDYERFKEKEIAKNEKA